QFFDEPLENATPDLGVRHFTPAEENRRLDLVTFFEEALDVLLLELIIVFVDLGAELDLFDENHFLVLLRLTRALLLLVLVLAEVHDAADGRVCGRRDLDQVETLGLGNRQRLRRRHDAELRSVVVDDANFSNTNAFVHTNAVVTARSSVECDKCLLVKNGFGLSALGFSKNIACPPALKPKVQSLKPVSASVRFPRAQPSRHRLRFSAP